MCKVLPLLLLWQLILRFFRFLDTANGGFGDNRWYTATEEPEGVALVTGQALTLTYSLEPLSTSGDSHLRVVQSSAAQDHSCKTAGFFKTCKKM